MIIDFECNSCNGDFEIDVDELFENPKQIKCPHCKNSKLDAKATEEFSSALEELVSQVAMMSKKFNLTMTIETDDLPGTYATEEEEAEEADEEDLDIDDELDTEDLDEDEA